MNFTYKLLPNPKQILRSDDEIIPDITANHGDALLYREWEADGGIPDPADPLPSIPPNWDALYYRLLATDLKPIFDDLESHAVTDVAINWRLTALNTAIGRIQTEQALRDCLDKLLASGYVVSDIHKSLWNGAIAELNFSDLVKL